MLMRLKIQTFMMSGQLFVIPSLWLGLNHLIGILQWSRPMAHCSAFAAALPHASPLTDGEELWTLYPRLPDESQMATSSEVVVGNGHLVLGTSSILRRFSNCFLCSIFFCALPFFSVACRVEQEAVVSSQVPAATRFAEDEQSLETNVICFSSAISACELPGQWVVALEVLNWMDDWQVAFRWILANSHCRTTLLWGWRDRSF